MTTDDELLIQITGGTNHTMAEEHLRYRKALVGVVELHKAYLDDWDNVLRCGECTEGDGDGVPYPCATVKAVNKELQ